MEPNVVAYLESWSHELSSKANRVRHLIGDAHWLSDGHHKEDLLREFLSRYLPRDLIVSRGFVKSAADLTTCSPEIDILISDLRLNPPLFFEGGLQIVDASSAIAHIEVKTTFARTSLVNALTNSCKTQSLIATQKSTELVCSAIHFYAGTPEPESALDTLEGAVGEVVKAGTDAGWLNITCWPAAITIMGQFAIFLSMDDKRALRCRLFETGDLSLPCALGDLFGFVRRVRGGAALSGFDNVIEAVKVPPPHHRLISL